MPLATLESELEKEHILKSLQAAEGNKAKAAASLGISRETLYQKLRGYDLH